MDPNKDELKLSKCEPSFLVAWDAIVEDNNHILLFSVVLSLALALALALDSRARIRLEPAFPEGLINCFSFLEFFTDVAVTNLVVDLPWESDSMVDFSNPRVEDAGLWMPRPPSWGSEMAVSSWMACLDMLKSHCTVLLPWSKPSMSWRSKNLRATSLESRIRRSLGPFAVSILLFLSVLHDLLRVKLPLRFFLINGEAVAKELSTGGRDGGGEGKGTAPVTAPRGRGRPSEAKIGKWRLLGGGRGLSSSWLPRGFSMGFEQ